MNGEPPLDPAAERLQARLKRLLFGSSLIMVLGFIAVFGAIIYRLTSDDSAPEAGRFASTIAIGAEAEVLQTSLTDGVLIVLVRDGTATAMLRIDPVTGRHLSRTDFVAR